MEVITINWQLPTEDDVVEERERERRGDTVVREHVRHHTNLVVQGSVAPDKLAERGSDGTFIEPLVKRVKDQLGATWRSMSLGQSHQLCKKEIHHRHTSASD